jgi:histidinol dehydrogenase
MGEADVLPEKVMKLGDARERLLRDRWPRRRGLDQELLKHVEEIIMNVKVRGDKALVELTEKFDGVKIGVEDLRVERRDIEEAYSKVSGEQISAIKAAKRRIEDLEGRILSSFVFNYEDELGVKVHREPKPIKSVGCYVPGGRFPYPSTLIMAVTPAKVAGVTRVAVCSPPSRGGEIHPLILVAADICGVDEVYRVGGAQAVAALAYGTETIDPVEKIVGPGNRYVMAAKMIVSRDVPIDHPAGPSEIMVLADDSANPYYIALDLMSQMEHGPDAMAILVALSPRIAELALREAACLAGAINEGMLILVAESLNEALEFINEFAPEHLEVITNNAYEVSRRIHSAGLILIGGSTPVALSDYCLGTNHIIPTGGYSRVYQPLSSLNFIRFTNIVECTPKALMALSNNAKILAESEGLLRHASAIGERVKIGQKDS